MATFKKQSSPNGKPKKVKAGKGIAAPKPRKPRGLPKSKGNIPFGQVMDQEMARMQQGPKKTPANRALTPDQEKAHSQLVKLRKTNPRQYRRMVARLGK